MMMTIRPARLEDDDAIAEIHNQGIVDRVATLDTALRTPADVREWLAERGRWLAERGGGQAVIVAVAGNRPKEALEPVVIGWASLNPFNPRAAYDLVADFSVYVERTWRNRGVGGQLLDRLVEMARNAGFHKLVLAALAHNHAGVALYQKTGFTRVGIYHEMGQLDGKWVDVLLMERTL